MNLQNLQTNRYLLLVNIFFVIYIVVKAGFPSYEGIYSLMGFMMLLVAGVAGFRACISFGGRRNFTGRIALYFSVALFLVAVSILASSLAASGMLSYGSAGDLSILDLAAFVLAQCISTYALIVSVRAVIDGLNTRAIVYITLSLLFSIGIAWFNFEIGAQVGFIRTTLDQVFWVGAFPFLIFLQLASALLLIDLLGKWYATQIIGVIAIGFVCFDLLLPPVMAFILVTLLGFLGNQVTTLLTGISIQAVGAMYLVSIALTQMRPRDRGPFFATR